MDRNARGLMGLLAGLVIGVPISYYFQSGMVRAKLSLGAYISHLPELLGQSGQDIFPPLLLSCAVLGAAGWFVGRHAGSSA